MAAPRRRDRLGEFVRQEVARILLGGLSDPRLVGVAVTRCEVSEDIQQATVYVRVIGEEAKGRAALRALQGASGRIRHELGEALQARYTPKLTFRIDEAVDRERRMNALLDQVSRELGEGGEKPD